MGKKSAKGTEITLSNAIDLFLGEQIESTRRSYFYVLKDMMAWLGPGRPIKSVQPQILVEYIQDVRARPAIKSPATSNKYVKTVKTLFSWAIRMGYLESSPADPLRYIRTETAIRRNKAMTDSELEKLLDYAKWNPRDHALLLFLADTGCRARGAADLQVQDINLEAMTAEIIEKGNKSRIVWFGPECKAALSTWLKKRLPSAGPYVFTKNGQRLVNNNQVGQIVRRICQHVGIRGLGSHSLRHRKGMQLADAKVPASVAATALGHEDPVITLRYYYPKDTERAEAAMRELTRGAGVSDEQPAAEEKESPKIIDFSKRIVNR